MNMQSHRLTRRLRQRGLSLIEILVGMAIAMVGVVIMMEVLLNSEQRTRSSNAGNDALSTGAVASHLIRRDVVQGGYGLNATALLGCNVALPSGKTVPMSPVRIITDPADQTLLPSGDPNTDRLLVFYGNDNSQPEGQTVKGTGASKYTVDAPSAFVVGHRVIGAPNTCTGTLTLARVTAVDLVTKEVTIDSAADAAHTVLYNLGRTPRVVGYLVRNGSLMQCDYMTSDCSTYNATNWTALAGNIVSLRAQYGKDTNGGAPDGIIDDWNQTTPANVCQWSRASAVRFALVARSDQYESQIDAATKARVCEPVTEAAPAWSGASSPTPVPIDLTKKPDGTANPDWQCYRYRTFETVAPTRNIVWMRAAC